MVLPATSLSCTALRLAIFALCRASSSFGVAIQSQWAAKPLSSRRATPIKRATVPLTGIKREHGARTPVRYSAAAPATVVGELTVKSHWDYRKGNREGGRQRRPESQETCRRERRDPGRSAGRRDAQGKLDL